LWEGRRGTNEEFGSPAFSHPSVAFGRLAILSRELDFKTCSFEGGVRDRGLCGLSVSIRVCELAGYERKEEECGERTGWIMTVICHWDQDFRGRHRDNRRSLQLRLRVSLAAVLAGDSRLRQEKYISSHVKMRSGIPRQSFSLAAYLRFLVTVEGLFCGGTSVGNLLHSSSFLHIFSREIMPSAGTDSLPPLHRGLR
jgi:hypothetical protein